MAGRELIIGIDLGTTNSVVATVEADQPLVVRTRQGSNLTPSVVALSTSGKRLVGHLAKRQATTNPTGTVYASKRLIGRKFSSAQVKEASARLPYEVACGEHDDVRVMLGGKDLALPEISAMILRELKADAEAYAGAPVTKAVITVPAHFNDGQRQATRDAGVIAGLDVLRIINEPTAAALAYGFGKALEGKIAVFDLGGGTFDVSVLEISSGVFEVIATGGDTFLGGEDFDNRVIDWLTATFLAENGVDLKTDRMALQRLKDAAEKAKIDLSTLKEVQISLPFISTPGGGGALHLQAQLTRAMLEELTADLVQKTIDICDGVLREARVKPIDLREMILVGGMTRMPRVFEAVRAHFKRDPCTSVNPDEVVALGAAVQGAALTEERHEVVLLDVTPLSLGVAVAGGYVRRLIPRNTTVPTSVTESFNTSKDGQTTVKIGVLQGESELAHQNELLGEFTLTGLREARRGEVEVAVTFEINSEGIVSVSARDKETGAVQSITVTASGGLTRDELFDIMDTQADYLLETRSTDELSSRREELTSLLVELQALLRQVPPSTSGTDFGAEALSKATQALQQARVDVEKGTLASVTESIARLTRAATVFQALLQRQG